MPHKQTALDAVRAHCPELMELSFGCEIEHIYWYKTEADKKKGNIDWMQTGHHEDGQRGVVVKDLRDSDHLPMWVDYGDQLEFQIDAEDIVSFDIIGHQPQLQHWLRLLEPAISCGDLHGEYIIDQKEFMFVDEEGDPILTFSLTDGQPSTEEDYKKICELIV